MTTRFKATCLATGAAVAALPMLASCSSGSGALELTVRVQYSENQYGSVTCDAGNKLDRQVAGGQVTVSDSGGSKIATDRLPSSTRELSAEEAGADAGGCEWEVTLADTPDSDVYTIALALPGGYSDESDFSRSDLEADDWTATFSLSN